ELDGRIVVGVENDIPEQAGRPVKGVVDEDDLDTDYSTGSESDGLADGPAVKVEGSLSSLVKSGADEPVVFSFDTEDGSLSEDAKAFLEGQNLTSHGDELFYRINDNGKLVGRAKDENDEGRAVFRLTLEENGDYKFVLLDQLDHPDGNGQNSLYIDLSAAVNATDFDKDTVNLGDFEYGDDIPAFRIQVVDDVPVQAGEPVKGVVDEDDLDNANSTGTDSDGLGDGPAVTAQGSLSSLVQSGADEPVTFGFATDNGSLSDDAKAFLEGQSLSSQGDDLFYVINNNGKLVARAKDENDDVRAVFRVTLDEDGNYKFNLLDQLDHPDGNGENSLYIDLSGAVEATDYDGDTVNLGDFDYGNYPAFSIEVVDDIPVKAGEPVKAVVDEDDLDNDLSTGTDTDGLGDGPAVTAQGSLSSLVQSGADEPVTFGFVTENGSLSDDAKAFLEGQNLSSQGDDLFYVINNNGKLVARAKDENDDVRAVFRVTLEEDGNYKFNLLDQLDHPDGNGENSLYIDLSGAVEATDYDGDTVNLSDLDYGKEAAFSIEVVDDVPQVIQTAQYYFVSEYAGYNNIIGTYELDDGGNPTNPQIIIAETNDLANFSQAGPPRTDLADKYKYGEDGQENGSGPNQYTEGVNLGTYTEGTKMFLIADGGNKNIPVKVDENSELRFGPENQLQIKNDANEWVDVDPGGNKGIYYMDSQYDTIPPGTWRGDGDTPDGLNHFTDQWAESPWPQHFISEVPKFGGEVRIEDLNLGDGDYDDTVLRVEKGAVVSESHLDDGTKSDPNTATMAEGNFFQSSAAGIQFVSGADEPLKLTIDSSGIYTPDGFVESGDQDVEITIEKDGSDANSVTIQSGPGILEVWENGDWKYTLLDNTTVHPDNDKGSRDKHDGDYDRYAADQVQDVFHITASDYDGDEVVANFVININDDGPQIGFVDQPLATGFVHEDALNQDYDPVDGPIKNIANNNDEDLSDGLLDHDQQTDQTTFDLSALLDANYGADGPGSISYEIKNPDGYDSGYTSDGVAIKYYKDGDDLVAKAGDLEIYRLEVDSSTGKATFNLNDQIDHGNGKDGEYGTADDVPVGDTGALTIDNLGQFVEVTITDADNDTAKGTLDGMINVSVENDVPEAVETVAKSLNLVLVLDNSGSMYNNKIKWEGKEDTSRAVALQSAVIGLLETLDASAAEDIRVHIVEFNTDGKSLGTFDLKSGGELQDAKDIINNLPGFRDPNTNNPVYRDQFTNYEAGFQTALDWTNGTEPLDGDNVVNQVLFISDGDPNTYNDDDNGDQPYPGDGSTVPASVALDHVTGDAGPKDTTSELQALQAWGTVDTVGIAVNSGQLNRLSELDADGADSISSGDELEALLPELVFNRIVARVDEDDLSSTVSDGTYALDNDDGTDGPGNDDEDLAGNLSTLFESGADEELTYSVATDLSNLPELFSGGVKVHYFNESGSLVARVGNTDGTANAAGEKVFIFDVNADGSWVFDLQANLDHEDGDGQNTNLVTDGGVVAGIDLSSVIIATDTDLDSVPADEGAFVVEVKDDVPDASADAMDAILVNEAGNELLAALNVVPGADGISDIAITPLDEKGNRVSDGDKVYENGEPLQVDGKDVYWKDNGDGSWSAVTKSSSQGAAPAATSVIFTVAPEYAGGEFTGNYTVEQESEFGNDGSFLFSFKQQGGGRAEEKVFTTSDGVKITVTADSPNGDPDYVNWSNQGIGVDNNLINEAGPNDITEVLTFKFSDSDDEPLDITSATFRLDHLDNPPGPGNTEKAVWEAYSDGVLVADGKLNGSGNGAAPQFDQNLTINPTGDVTFDEVRLSIKTADPNAEGYRVEKVSVEYETVEDHEFDFVADVTDGDGDVVETEFDVTFDADGVVQGGSESEVISGSSEDDVLKGGGGNDVIIGNEGEDEIFGEGGVDVVVGDSVELDPAGGTTVVDDGEVDNLNGGPALDVVADPGGEDNHSIGNEVDDIDNYIPPVDPTP
ncbi:MAG: VWA domain-containing protein, partial [Desulfobulbaceae bacterium]